MSDGGGGGVSVPVVASRGEAMPQSCNEICSPGIQSVLLSAERISKQRCNMLADKGLRGWWHIQLHCVARPPLLCTRPTHVDNDGQKIEQCK